MNADCSTNALSNLSKYAQTDNTLRNEASRRNIGNQPQQFKSQVGVDHNLNQEFNKFTRSNNNTFANNFMEQIQHQRVQIGDHSQRENGWVQNFSQLSLNQNPVLGDREVNHQSNLLNQSGSAWHEQFMKHNHQHNTINPSLQNHQYTPAYNQDFRMMNNNMGPIYSQNTNLTEHKEVHKLEEELKAFENHFEMIEKELNEQSMQQEPLDFETDKDKFAETAKQVHNTMINSDTSAETNSKFQNSNFLKLMTAIGNRNIELEGDKLVSTSNGEDIRQHLSDPLKDFRQEDGNIHLEEPLRNTQIPSSQPSYSQTESNRPHVSHLPDPLAHLKDGDLANISEPLQAARIVSGNQVQPKNWIESFESFERPSPRRSILTPQQQEVYDDYRSDDP